MTYLVSFVDAFFFSSAAKLWQDFFVGWANSWTPSTARQACVVLTRRILSIWQEQSEDEEAACSDSVLTLRKTATCRFRGRCSALDMVVIFDEL